MRLTDVANATSMSKTAAHRCLAGLVARGLAACDGDTNRYHIGDRILAWATLARTVRAGQPDHALPAAARRRTARHPSTSRCAGATT